MTSDFFKVDFYVRKVKSKSMCVCTMYSCGYVIQVSDYVMK